MEIIPSKEQPQHAEREFRKIPSSMDDFCSGPHVLFLIPG
jgi:hypothetical protein